MRIGITERGDAGLDLSWYHTLLIGRASYDGVVLITKNANDTFIEKVMALYHNGFQKIIIHITCTGWGNTSMEPHVPSPDVQLSQMEKLIQTGFPVSHLVFRVDPVIPTQEGIQRADCVLSHPIIQRYKNDIRVRTSILDKYQHVCNRINPILQSHYTARTDFYPSRQELSDVLCLIRSHLELQFETCAEPILVQRAVREQISNIRESGCIAQTELHLFHLPDAPEANIRKGCKCLSCKTELLNNRKRCPHQCAYCYWKD